MELKKRKRVIRRLKGSWKLNQMLEEEPEEAAKTREVNFENLFFDAKHRREDQIRAKD